MDENRAAADKFAQTKDSKVLKYRVEPDPLDEEVMLHVIILEDGRKFKLTDEELKAAIKASEKPTPAPARASRKTN